MKCEICYMPIKCNEGRHYYLLLQYGDLSGGEVETYYYRNYNDQYYGKGHNQHNNAKYDIMYCDCCSHHVKTLINVNNHLNIPISIPVRQSKRYALRIFKGGKNGR